ncbi:MAG: hydrogenase formation protein HypD [Bacillota bacterium]
MELLQKYRDPELGKQILLRIKHQVGRPLRIMEVCGTHTVAISRFGIRELLHGILDFRSGPGCPVCVTDSGEIDQMVELAKLPNVIVVTFGDLMKVPGSYSSLSQEKTKGCDVRIVYSPLDGLKIARDNPQKQVVFLGIGFETTIPVFSLCLEEAMEKGIGNFSVLSAQKTVPPALEALLNDAAINIDGFILPGHVSAILGRQCFEFLASKYNMPAVITGFEPVDILAAVALLCEMICQGQAKVLNAYTRVVREEGNPAAKSAIDKFFIPVPAVWRGLGLIPASGMRLREEYAMFDAGRIFEINLSPAQLLPGCVCGEVLKGKITPRECQLFGNACSPVHPVGPCMVSSEGACMAYFQYEGGMGRV